MVCNVEELNKHSLHGDLASVPRPVEDDCAVGSVAKLLSRVHFQVSDPNDIRAWLIKVGADCLNVGPWRVIVPLELVEATNGVFDLIGRRRVAAGRGRSFLLQGAGILFLVCFAPAVASARRTLLLWALGLLARGGSRGHGAGGIDFPDGVCHRLRV